MWPDKDLIHFLSPIHLCYVSFPYCTNCSSGSSLWQRNICEIPSFSSFSSVMSSLSIHLLLGSWQLYLFCRSVVILAGMGWAALFLPSTPDSLFSLGAELLWSSLGWRLSLSRSILELSICVVKASASARHRICLCFVTLRSERATFQQSGWSS